MCCEHQKFNTNRYRALSQPAQCDTILDCLVFVVILLLLLPVGPAETPSCAPQPFEDYCAKPRFSSPVHLQSRSTSDSVRASISERRNYGREMAGQIYPNKWDFHVIVGSFNLSQSCDRGQTALLPLRRKACWGFFDPKIRRLRPGLK
jgi:hypothetical protein